MPTVVKQTMRTARPSQNGSILSRAVPVAGLRDDWIKISIYGRNRVGKTTLACTFPKPLLLVSFEPARTGGARSIRKVPGVEYIHLSSIPEVEKLAGELASDTHFKTHVLDTITSLQDALLAQILDLPDVPEQWAFGSAGKTEYQRRSERTKDVLRPFLNLKAHTVVLAKEKDHSPPKGDEIWEGYGRRKLNADIDAMRVDSYFAESIGTSAADWLHDACDFVCRLYLTKEVMVQQRTVKVAGQNQIVKEEIETGKIVRRLRTLYHANYAAGFRSDVLDIPEYIENPTYDRLVQVIEGKWKAPAK